MRLYDDEALQQAAKAEETLELCDELIRTIPTDDDEMVSAVQSGVAHLTMKASVHAALAVAYSRIGKS